MLWQILNTDQKDIIKALYENRGLKTEQEIEDFINPKPPDSIDVPKNIIKRLEIAKKTKKK